MFGREPVGVEGARQQEVDGDVRCRRPSARRRPRSAVRPARAPEERSRPASGIFTEPDVMLTMRPNFLRTIGSIDFLDQLDRHHHVGDDAVDHLLPVELAEIAERRAGIVVHQDVGLRAGGEQRGLAVRRRDVGHHRDDLGAGRLARVRPRVPLRVLAVAAVDHDLAAGLRQRRARRRGRARGSMRRRWPCGP